MTRSSRSQSCAAVVSVVEISPPQSARFFEIAARRRRSVSVTYVRRRRSRTFGLPQRSEFYRLTGLVLVKKHSRYSRKTGTIYNPLLSIVLLQPSRTALAMSGFEKDSALACNRVNSATLRYEIDNLAIGCYSFRDVKSVKSVEISK